MKISEPGKIYVNADVARIFPTEKIFLRLRAVTAKEVCWVYKRLMSDGRGNKRNFFHQILRNATTSSIKKYQALSLRARTLLLSYDCDCKQLWRQKSLTRWVADETSIPFYDNPSN